jgi:integrase/recombinase XerD
VPTAQLPIEVEELLSWLAVERGRSQNTLLAYRRDLTEYTTWLRARSTSLAAASRGDVEAYVAHLRTSGRAPSSAARAVAAVRGLHRFLADEGHAGADPAHEVRGPRVPAGLPKPLAEAEVVALIEGVDGDDPVSRRDRAVLEVLYGSGMRVSELCGLSLGDVDPDAGLVRVFGKGAKERIVPLGRMALGALDRWLEPGGRPELTPARWARRGDAEALFLNQRGARLSRQSAWGIVELRGHRAGLPAGLSPHVLRHSCATHLLDHGADIRVVQELLGHASVSTTQVYTKVSDETLRAAFTAAHPRAVVRGVGH